MGNEVKFIVSAETQQAAAALTKFNRDVASGMNQLVGRTGVARDGLQALTRVSMLMGSRVAPQLTGSIMLASDGWKTLKGTADLAGVGLSRASLIIAGITAIVGTATAALKAHAAAWDEVRARQNLSATLQENYLRNVNRVLDAQKAGKLNDPDATKLIDQLGSSDEVERKKAIARLRELGSTKERLESVKNLAKAEQDIRLGALEGFDKEKAEAVRTKGERLAAIEDELKNFASFQELKTAMIDAGRAHEIAGLDSVQAYRKRLADAADSEFQAAMAKADANEKQRRDKEWDDRQQGAIDRFKLEQKLIEDEAKLIASFQRDQMLADDEALERARNARQDRANQIGGDFRLSEAEKYRTYDAEGFRPQGPNVDSFGENLTSNLSQLQNQFGTFSQASAAMITGGIGTAIQGVSDGIMGLIDGTKTWAQTWGSILKSMAAQGIQFIVQQLAQFVLSKGKELLLFLTTEKVKTTAAVVGAEVRGDAALGEAGKEGVVTGAKAAGSVASIPYVGWALAIAAFAGVVAMIASASSNARELGGPVRAGQPHLVGEGGPEIFVPRTAGYVLNNSDSMKVMSGGGGAGGAQSQAAGGVNIKTVIVANMQQAMEEVMASARGTRIIVQTIDGGRLDLGLPT